MKDDILKKHLESQPRSQGPLSSSRGRRREDPGNEVARKSFTYPQAVHVNDHVLSYHKAAPCLKEPTAMSRQNLKRKEKTLTDLKLIYPF